MNVLDLFSGIGGFSLGLERAGMRTVAFCEVEPYARRVLAKHWPDVLCYTDVRDLTANQLGADGISVDVICGGFPCQDISVAGKGAGISEGTRSGLWSEYARLIGELRPRYVIVENVAALLNRGIDVVLGDLAALGYDAEWHCIPASAIGAPHRRDRVWIVANSHCCGRNISECDKQEVDNRYAAIGTCSLADTNSARLEEWQGKDSSGARSIFRPVLERNEWWFTEPDVGRVAHGIPDRAHRLRGLGNAVVPQIPEIIGRAIMRAATLSPADGKTP